MANSSDSARQFFKTIKKTGGTPSPCYLIFGEETFLLDLALREVMQAVLPRGVNDFNFDQFHGREVVGDKVVGACETLALMGGRRLVLVKDIASVPTPQLHVLADYLKNPCPSTTLVCHGQTASKKLQKTTKFYKEAKAVGVVQEFEALREWEIGTFLKRQAATRGLTLTPESEDALIKAVGTDLATLDAALEKLDLFLGVGQGARRVDPDALLEIVAATRTQDIWELTDAVARRDLRASLDLLTAMLEQGQTGVGINMMVARHFRQLWQVKAALARGLSKQDIAKEVGMNPFFVDRFRDACRRFTGPQLRHILGVLLATDRSLKSSRLRDQILLERMILAVCAG